MTFRELLNRLGARFDEDPKVYHVGMVDQPNGVGWIGDVRITDEHGPVICEVWRLAPKINDAVVCYLKAVPVDGRYTVTKFTVNGNRIRCEDGLACEVVRSILATIAARRLPDLRATLKAHNLLLRLVPSQRDRLG